MAGGGDGYFLELHDGGKKLTGEIDLVFSFKFFLFSFFIPFFFGLFFQFTFSSFFFIPNFSLLCFHTQLPVLSLTLHAISSLSVSNDLERFLACFMCCLHLM